MSTGVGRLDGTRGALVMELPCRIPSVLGVLASFVEFAARRLLDSARAAVVYRKHREY